MTEQNQLTVDVYVFVTEADRRSGDKSRGKRVGTASNFNELTQVYPLGRGLFGYFNTDDGLAIDYKDVMAAWGELPWAAR